MLILYEICKSACNCFEFCCLSVVYPLSASFNAIRPAVERIGQKLSYVLKEYI